MIKKLLKYLFLPLGILLLLVAGFFFLVRKLDNNALEMKDFYTSLYKAGKPVLLPSAFINGERFYIKMQTVNGDTILGFGDTGGGISMVMPSTVDKLRLESKLKWAIFKGVMPVQYIPFSDI